MVEKGSLFSMFSKWRCVYFSSFFFLNFKSIGFLALVVWICFLNLSGVDIFLHITCALLFLYHFDQVGIYFLKYTTKYIIMFCVVKLPILNPSASQGKAMWFYHLRLLQAKNIKHPLLKLCSLGVKKKRLTILCRVFFVSFD